MYRSCTENAEQRTVSHRSRNRCVLRLAAWGTEVWLDRPAFSPLGQNFAEKSPRVQGQHKSLWALRKGQGNIGDWLAPQIRLESTLKRSFNNMQVSG